MTKYYARCKLGKGSSFWCVWDVGLFEGMPPIAHGYETTVEAAEHKAREVAGEDANAGNAYWALRVHREFVAEHRRERSARSKNTHRIE